MKNQQTSNQPYYRELFLQYTQLIRLLQLVDLIEEVIATVVNNHALESEVQRKDARRLASIILHAGLQDIANRLIPEKPEDLAQSIYLQQILKQSCTTQSRDIASPVDAL